MHTKSSSKELFKRLSVSFILVILFIFFLFYIFPKVVHLLYPILLAYLVAALVNPLVNKINRGFRHTKLNSVLTRNLVALFMTFLIIILISMVVYFTFATFINEVIGLATGIQNNWESIVRFFERIERWLSMQMIALPEPILDVFENFTKSILTFIQNFSNNLLSYAVTFTGLLISRTGTFSLNVITFFLSLYFILSDINFITEYLFRRMNIKLLESLKLLKDSALLGVFGYIKTQVILAGVAFVYMFVALTLYGQPYSFVIALIIALVDVLPLLGTMAVILPWGIYEFIIGDVNQGIFVLLLGILFFILRRIIEPKIMGVQTGLHPLLTLIGIYAGIRLSGLWRALLGPLVIILFSSLIRSGAMDHTIADLSELFHKTANLLKREESV